MGEVGMAYYALKEDKISKLFWLINIIFMIAKSADPDDVSHLAAYHLSLHCPIYGK